MKTKISIPSIDAHRAKVVRMGSTMWLTAPLSQDGTVEVTLFLDGVQAQRLGRELFAQGVAAQRAADAFKDAQVPSGPAYDVAIAVAEAVDAAPDARD